ncbi:Transmembrane protein [Azospirillaceae bacterium]
MFDSKKSTIAPAPEVSTKHSEANPSSGKTKNAPVTRVELLLKQVLGGIAACAAAGLIGCCVLFFSLSLFNLEAIGSQSLVADLSNHLVAINTSFTGTEVVLFGVVEGPGDIAVVVTGPRTAVTVRRKDRVAGIWINQDSVRFKSVPGFYAVATNRPLDAIVNSSVLARHQIGLEHLALTPTEPTSPNQVAEFRRSLIRGKQRQGLYGTKLGQVSFLGDRLFRTNISFPANVPIGHYTVSVFLIRGGDVMTAQTTPLVVGKVGLSFEIYDFAQRRPFGYGLAAIAGAVIMGWLASALFGRP